MNIRITDGASSVDIPIHSQLEAVFPVIRQHLSRVAPSYSLSNLDALAWLVEEVLIPRIAMLGGTTVPVSPAEEAAIAALKKAREDGRVAKPSAKRPL